MSEIFISYSRQDEDFINGLVADLERKRLDVYYDKRLKPGDDYDEILSAKLDGAKYVLVALSPASLASRNVRAELKRALQRQREGRTTVIPLLVVPCDPKRLREIIGPRQYADFTKDYEAGLEELLSSLAGPGRPAGEAEDAQEGEELSPMSSDRKTKIILAIISAAVALTVAYWQFVYKPTPTPDKKLSYQGLVVNIENQQEIEGARVSVDAESNYTDSNGVFHLNLSGASDVIRVRVMANGYKPFNEIVPLTGERKFGDIRLTPTATNASPSPTAQPSVPGGRARVTPSATRVQPATNDGRPTRPASPSNVNDAVNALDIKSPTPRP